MSALHPTPEHRVLFDFTTGETAGHTGGREWTTASDAAWGGKSFAAFEREARSAAFRGVTSLELPADGAASRTGFCAARSSPWPDHELVDCDDYGALELCLRTDGRTYGINLDVDSFFTGELFQGFLTLPASREWRTVILPFEKFVLTRGGRFTERQRHLDRRQVRSLGFSITDGKHGPFRLEIRHVRAVEPVVP